MNLRPYIESGILELYVLNLLSGEEQLGVERMLKTYPALLKEVSEIEVTLESLALAHGVKPSPETEKKLLASIQSIVKEKPLGIEELSLINEETDYLAWLPLLSGYSDDLLVNGAFTKVLQHTDKLTQILVVSQLDIPEEVHDDEQESFLILEGKCECIISGKSRIMGPGDFMEIPLHEPHDVLLISPTVAAILQRVKLS